MHLYILQNSGTGGNWFYVGVGAIITIVGQWILHEYRRWQERESTEQAKLNLLRTELEDLMRHCARNLQVLNAIDLNKGVPSDFHFKKMKILETSFIFNSEIYSNINRTYSRKVHELRKKVTNLNTEIEACLVYLNDKKFKFSKLEEYISYLKGKMLFTIETMPKAIKQLSDEPWKTTVDIKELLDNAAQEPPFPLIYK